MQKRGTPLLYSGGQPAFFFCYTSYMKRPYSKKQWLAEAAGWYGAVAILTAYILASFAIIAPSDAVFQLLNLSGSLGIAAIALYKRVVQSLILNIIWAAVALGALFMQVGL